MICVHDLGQNGVPTRQVWSGWPDDPAATALAVCVERQPILHEEVVAGRPCVLVEKSLRGVYTCMHCTPPYLHELVSL